MKTSYKAAILDLDGVLTQTASVHAKAWKKMFDEYNEIRKKNQKQPYKPFTIEEDYKKHLDGMPRYVGVANFLASRLIELPHGDPTDKPGTSTICALGNLKNKYFQELIKEDGVEIFETNVNILRQWKKKGLKTAVVSSSKNCKPIIEAAGIGELFDVRVDGVLASELNLKGKPCADIFLEAAKRLNVSPDKAIVVEDATAGVEAGRKGKFKLVVGIGKEKSHNELKRMGAHVAIQDLAQLDLSTASAMTFAQLPNANDRIENILDASRNHQILTFLDFDGTLTPIVDNPEDAILSENMFSTLCALAKICPTGIISGRDLQDVMHKANLDQLYYAGSHGYEIRGPNNLHHEYEKARELLPVLEKAESKLHQELEDVKDITIERKRYAIAVHFRQAGDGAENKIKQIAEEITQDMEGLKVEGGKKIVEVLPDLNWHKGKALNYLVEHITSSDQKTYCLYLGDDLTDEDAFAAIENGVGVLVGDHKHHTAADYGLDTVSEVEHFLQKLLSHLKR